jgi:hypothetical protein
MLQFSWFSVTERRHVAMEQFCKLMPRLYPIKAGYYKVIAKPDKDKRSNCEFVD